MAKRYRTRDHHAGARRIPAILAALIAAPIVAFATPGCDELIEDDDAPFGDAAAAGDEEPVTKRDTLADPTNGTSVYVGAKQWKQYTFTKTAGWRYTVCVESTDGDVDLYGHYAGPPSTTSYQYGSIHAPSGTAAATTASPSPRRRAGHTTSASAASTTTAARSATADRRRTTTWCPATCRGS